MIDFGLPEPVCSCEATSGPGGRQPIHGPVIPRNARQPPVPASFSKSRDQHGGHPMRLNVYINV